MFRALSWSIVVALSLGACTGAGSATPVSSASGRPEVDKRAIAEHAAQFDEKLPSRPPGSQQEFAAAAYILAHLQQAGYVARLDSVPFDNDVNSTNVVALPPSGGAPTVAVVVPYGTGPGFPSNGAAIGLFLELARALNVAFPRHSIEFVALGAEHTSLHEGALGSRRLAKVLLDEHQEPLVVYLAVRSAAGSLSANPDGSAILLWRLLMHIAYGRHHPGPSADAIAPDVFATAGFPRIVVGGDPAQVAGPLLRFLESPGVQPSPSSS